MKLRKRGEIIYPWVEDVNIRDNDISFLRVVDQDST